MSTPRIPKYLANLIRNRARHSCEFCQSSEWLTGQHCQIDHIIPRCRGGVTEPENLCLACVACNSFKLDQTHAADPESGEIVALFNPRQHEWNNHFVWSDNVTHIIGLTACGRATIVALKMN